MSSFKKEIEKRDRHCLISKAHPRESDACHIIQQFVCYHLQKEDLLLNSYNGLLLFSGFHRSYDRYIWSLDVFSLGRGENRIGSNWCELDLVVAPDYKGYFIHQYHGKPIKVPLKSLPYLWVDYQVFVDKNFLGEKGLIANYRRHLQSPVFQSLMDDPLGTFLRLKMGSGLRPRAIIQYDLYQDHYLVLGDRQTWKLNRWVKGSDLPKELIQVFQDVQDRKKDEDFQPPRKRQKPDETSSTYNLRHTDRVVYTDDENLSSSH